MKTKMILMLVAGVLFAGCTQAQKSLLNKMTIRVFTVYLLDYSVEYLSIAEAVKY